MTDLRDLCARMANELDHYRQLLMDDRSEVHALAAEARAELDKPEPEGPTDEDVERAAQHVFEAMRFSAGVPTPAPPWVEGGNSFMQDRARKAARDILNHQAS